MTCFVIFLFDPFIVIYINLHFYQLNMGVYVKMGCVLGLLISVYALWVERQVHNKSNYLALCDLHQYASCSRVLSSKLVKYLYFNNFVIILFFIISLLEY